MRLPKADFKPKSEVPWKTVESVFHVDIQTNQINETMKFLLDEGINLSKMEIRSQTLEDLFIQLTGKALRT